jgi:hypothetical protein
VNCSEEIGLSGQCGNVSVLESNRKRVCAVRMTTDAFQFSIINVYTGTYGGVGQFKFAGQ